eukprot:464595_1
MDAKEDASQSVLKKLNKQQYRHLWKEVQALIEGKNLTFDRKNTSSNCNLDTEQFFHICTDIARNLPDNKIHKQKNAKGFGTDLEYDPLYGALLVNENNTAINATGFGYWWHNTFQQNLNQADKPDPLGYNTKHVLTHFIKIGDERFQK